MLAKLLRFAVDLKRHKLYTIEYFVLSLQKLLIYKYKFYGIQHSVQDFCFITK
jgi:hypothetical protein